MPADTEVLALLRDIRDDVRDTRAEQTEGFKSVRSDLAQHTRDDAENFKSVRGEIADVRSDHAATRERVAAIEGKAAGEDRGFAAAVAGTGRFRALSSPHLEGYNGNGAAMPQEPYRVPPPPPVPASKHKRTSGFWSGVWSSLKKYLGHGAVALAAVVGTSLVHYLAGAGCETAQKVQAATERTTPATSSPPVVPLPFEPPTRPDRPRVQVDAGR